MKPIAHLPFPAVEKLLTYKIDKDEPGFDAYVLGLRAAGWPLRAIAEPFEVTRVTAKNWESRAVARGIDPATKGVPVLPLDVRGMRVRPKRIPADVPTKDRVRIAELSEQARKVRRWTLEGSAERRAADELHNLIYKYVIERGVPAAVFARYAGVSRRAIMQRVEKIKDDTITS